MAPRVSRKFKFFTKFSEHFLDSWQLFGGISRVVQMRSFSGVIPKRNTGEGQSVWGTGSTAESRKKLRIKSNFSTFFCASDCCMPVSGSNSLPTLKTFSFLFSGSVELPAFLFPVRFSGESLRATMYGRKKLNIFRIGMRYERL